MAIAKDKETKVEAADQVFAMMAAEEGLAEVQLAKLAADRAASPQVKQFAQRLVQDHTKANQELLRIADKNDISVPKEVSDTHEDAMKLFSKLEGVQFDREFPWYQVMHHEKDTAGFAVQAKEGHNSELKDFTVPSTTHRIL
jgi:putative membrane protein